MTSSGESPSASRPLFHRRSSAVHGRLLTTAPPTRVVASEPLEELRDVATGWLRASSDGLRVWDVPREDYSLVLQP